MTKLEVITMQLSDTIKQISSLNLSDKIETINKIKVLLNEVSPMKDHPIDLVLWVPIDSVKKNEYNPNSVAPTELKLLETSISEDGYTQPIVTWIAESGREIIDGFHRSKIARESSKVAAQIMGYVPVTTVRDRQVNKSNRMASTIRHNRARGSHSVDAMSEIVLELKARNWKTARICKELGMEEDEVLRLCQISGLSGLFSDVEFTKAWESDTASNDSELDFEADYTAITQNTSDASRIFHTFDKWEAVEAGFFAPGLKGRDKEECEQEYGVFLSDSNRFAEGIQKVFKEWPNSCEHNLTNSSMNRIAWIGQAAACAAIGLPSTYRGGFSKLPKEVQDVANNLALEYLNKWLSGRGMAVVTAEQAFSTRESDLF
jgi:ParB-like chromosome segregation protein Spo0J